MKNKFICLLLILVLSFSLFACNKNNESTESGNNTSVITNGVFKIGLLLSSESGDADISNNLEDGVHYANTVASSIFINENVNIEIVKENYSHSSYQASIDSLVNKGVAAVIFDASEPVSASAICDKFTELKIPLISLSSFAGKSEYVYNISLSESFQSACVSTYIRDNSFKSCALLCDNDSEYYKAFADIYNETLSAYAGIEADVLYFDALADSGVADAQYESVFIVCDNLNTALFVEKTKSLFPFADIILCEQFTKSNLLTDLFDSCAFLSNLEKDSLNNVSTKFYMDYSEFLGVPQKDITPAQAYGYDAYMCIFEALRSFADSNDNLPVFNDTSPVSTQADDNLITSDSLNLAIASIKYFGVTDYITFSENTVNTGFVFVSKINNGAIQSLNKYNFN